MKKEILHLEYLFSLYWYLLYTNYFSKCKVSKKLFCDLFSENAETPPAEAEGVSVILMVGLTKSQKVTLHELL